MSSSATNDLTKWSDEQLHEHKDGNEEYEEEVEEAEEYCDALEEPEVGLEEELEEEEVVEATKKRGALKGWSKEEAEVDESV
ncbi:hypothetical protein PAXRUDRAFT_16783 [Paxillus rubicundulus Ve08.2h10]|uniref:Uncharacterized protein n=1 Tax=Paxillus rubicundulus Ve08.2h10 TaxID=930991 RepID=A0A0D0CT89_9AGAM|nr:hypothetical protein PAXRUDRAFT_16783 [Paxillus rubicundulus Ve08.2h10]